MPRFNVVAGVALLVALGRARPSHAATATRHASTPSPSDLPPIVLSRSEPPFVGVVSCLINSADLALESVHSSPATVARRAGDVLSNLRIESPVTGVGVCVNDNGHVAGLRFVTARGSPRCGYWDPGTEVMVDLGSGASLAAVAMLRPSANASVDALTAGALQLRFTSHKKLGHASSGAHTRLRASKRRLGKSPR